MKTTILSALGLVICCMLQAQSDQVKYGTSMFDGGTRVSSSIEIENIDEDLVSKRWSSYLKNYDGKLKNHKGEYFLDNAKVAAISPDTLDMYSRVDESGDNVIVTLTINRNGEFISNAAGKEFGADDLLLRFKNQIKKEQAENEHAAAEKILKGMEKEMRELEDKNNKLSQEIKEMKSKIADNERSVSSNEKSIGEMNQKIREQDNVVKAAKSKVSEYK